MEEKKEHSAWESVVWHFRSRKSRLAMAAVIALILTNSKWIQEMIKLDPAGIPALAQNIVIVLGILVAAMSGEKIMMNGNGNGKAPDPKEGVTMSVESVVEMKLKEKLHEELEKGLDKLTDKIKEKINK